MSKTIELADKLSGKQTRQLSPIERLLHNPGFLVQLKKALPGAMSEERFARIALTEVRVNPALANCDPLSIAACLVQAAQLGLEPGSALGHVYLVPFKKTCQLIIGYRGMLELARRSGKIISLDAQVVYENDQFEHEFGLNPRLKHIPTLDYEKRGAIKAVYAIARMPENGFIFGVLPKGEVDEIRRISRSGNSGPWQQHYPAMAKKTVIRQLFKLLPISIEAQKAVGIDEAGDFSNEGQNLVEEIFGETVDVEAGEDQED